MRRLQSPMMTLRALVERLNSPVDWQEQGGLWTRRAIVRTQEIDDRRCVAMS